MDEQRTAPPLRDGVDVDHPISRCKQVLELLEDHGLDRPADDDDADTFGSEIVLRVGHARELYRLLESPE